MSSLTSTGCHPSSPPRDVSCRRGSVSPPHPSLRLLSVAAPLQLHFPSRSRTLNGKVLELIVFLQLRRGLCGGGGWLPVRRVAGGFCCGSSSLCGAGHDVYAEGELCGLVAVVARRWLMMYVGACEMAMHSCDAAQPLGRTGHVRVGYLLSLQLFADQYTQRSSSALTCLCRLATVLVLFSGRI